MLTPKISILIAHYHESAQPFLDACLKSLESQTFREFETIVVSSNHRPKLSGIVDKEVHSGTRLHFPAAISRAYEMTNPETESILLLNDDCIMGRDCLGALYHTLSTHPMEMILGARSNCGPIMGFYHTDSRFLSARGSISVGPQFRYDDVKDFVPDMIQNAVDYPPGIFQVPFSPFFCTLIKRSTYEKVGRIDPNFKTGSDDSDFAKRASKLGIGCYVALHATCFHASGVSADVGLTAEDREFNHRLYAEKHG
jgi:GT2 family glycosyltransferase